MTYGNRPEYQLAEKMKSRFSGRGAAVSGMQASPTSELMRKAQMGGDPNENCSELDFRNGAGRPLRTAQNGGYHPAYAAAPAYGTSGREAGQTAHSTRVRPAEPQKTAPKNPRPAPDSRNPKTEPKKTQKSAGSGRKTRNAKQTKSPEKPRSIRPQPVYAAGEIAEVKVEGRRMTPMFAVFLVIGTMMIMSIVLSFSEIYQTTSEIARLEADLAVLRDQAAELELELEEKNDIRIIEQIATGELGMVKEDAVQRKYISLSDGERIDIIEDETAENEAAPGVLLSSIWSSLGSLFDYFR